MDVLEGPEMFIDAYEDGLGVLAPASDEIPKTSKNLHLWGEAVLDRYQRLYCCNV